MNLNHRIDPGRHRRDRAPANLAAGHRARPPPPALGPPAAPDAEHRRCNSEPPPPSYRLQRRWRSRQRKGRCSPESPPPSYGRPHLPPVVHRPHLTPKRACALAKGKGRPDRGSVSNPVVYFFFRHSGFLSFRLFPIPVFCHSGFAVILIFSVIPAKAGIYALRWTPVFAGATDPHLKHPKGNTTPARTPATPSRSGRLPTQPIHTAPIVEATPYPNTIPPPRRQ